MWMTATALGVTTKTTSFFLSACHELNRTVLKLYTHVYFNTWQHVYFYAWLLQPVEQTTTIVNDLAPAVGAASCGPHAMMGAVPLQIDRG